MTETAPLNPRAVPGSNEAPDYAKQVTERLAAEYAAFPATFREICAEADKLLPIIDDSGALARGAIIKRLRDLDSRIESVRELEKEPYLRGGNAVDALMNGWRELIGKRNKNDRKAKDGRIDILQGEINDYQNEKLAKERARLEAERAAAAAVAAAAAKKAQDEARAAEEARLKAERARTAENITAKAAIAAQQAQEANASRVRAEQAAQAAEEARLATLARAADIVRVRGNDVSGAGVTLTAAQEPYAFMTDRNKINLDMLRPYFTDAEIDKALRGWAKATGHRIPMDGAEIGHRNKGVTR